MPKHEKVRLWLAQHSRYPGHCVPTYSAGLNQVEIWWGLLPARAIRRGACPSGKALSDKINRCGEAYNREATPFLGTATTDSILAKIGRLCASISETEY